MFARIAIARMEWYVIFYLLYVYLGDYLTYCLLQCAAKLHADYIYGVCTDYKKTSTIGKACDEETDCTVSNGERCVCNGNGESKCTNYNAYREFYKEMEEDEECQENARANCLSSANDVAFSKCIFEACEKSVCKSYKEGKKHYGYVQGCDLIQLCDASALFASLPLLAIAVFVMLFQ